MPVHLPDEIIWHILRNLVPSEKVELQYDYDAQLCLTSLAYASRVSRSFRRVAEPLLYRHLHCSSRQLLEALCNRPELCEHVRRIDGYGTSMSLEDRAVAERLLHGRIRGMVRDKYRWPALDALLERLIPPEVDPINNDEDYGYLDMAWLTFMLCLTPHVETLHVDSCLLDKPDMLARLFDLCGREGSPRQQRESGRVMVPRSSGPLSKLRSLQLGCDTVHGEPGGFGDRNVRPLVLFPGLEELVAVHMDWEYTGQGPNPYDHDEGEGEHEDTSDEEQLEDDQDQRCQAERPGDQTSQALPDRPPKRLYTFPGSHPNMKSLSLLHNNPPVYSTAREMLLACPNLDCLILLPWIFEDRETLDFTMYGNVLREFGTRLRRFELEPAIAHGDFSEVGDEGTIGSLREKLTRLEQLRIPLATLAGTDVTDVDDENSEQLDLCAFLPASLRWFWTGVTESGVAEVHYKALARMMDEITRGSQGDGCCRLPLLEWVMVQIPSKNDGPSFEPNGFDVLRLGKDQVLCTRKSARLGWTQTPPGWEGAPIDTDSWLP
ncbi:uncharacterized protein B0I36DRAFT_98456 [Microdochium trichocladiopsis]|uniref:F-box domain-containing protein n=1 Tax=Microdochium trichocladiopsis TaxID=1682393 RepID=A0A9P8YD07_9PEZI|nr:uncharacterized protein B0I36DRAFT_98456 [Microdochium trichocladiopsis]KAH7036007.1 hypothetical protein B0I36DRAFT_98456 [Microdochium trichocladiopsis]